MSAPSQETSARTKATRTQAVRTGKATRSGSFGRLQAVYRGQRVSRRDWVLIFLPLGLLVLCASVYSVWLVYSAYTRFGPAAALDWPRPWLIGAGLLLALLLVLLLHSLYLSSWKIFVYDGGLGIKHPPFKPLLLRWSQMSGIAFEFSQDRLLGIKLRSNARAVIFPTLGKPVRLDSRLPRLPALVDHIEANLFPVLWKPYTESLRAGQWLYFGRLSITREVLRLGKQQYPWETINRLWVENGRLVIELSGAAPLRLAVAQITNLELLLQLVEREIKP